MQRAFVLSGDRWVMSSGCNFWIMSGTETDLEEEAILGLCNFSTSESNTSYFVYAVLPFGRWRVGGCTHSAETANVGYPVHRHTTTKLVGLTSLVEIAI